MSSQTPTKPYKVLATKYRPRDFDSLVGQDVLVRTLTNSINNNRIANAFLLTGIRGVGKTTTARIIARALNCVGADGTGSATIKPCGLCSNCTSIMEDRHPDVIEMDAASRTGVDDIREVIENTHYMPISARYKVYIIDEVHMLSKNAFNALLKTLEEPPSHVKFIFATTEIRKIPVTILSRCQRFDLKRIEGVELANHLENIAAKEEVSISQEALLALSASAEGSVRDGLSLLDQVIAHADGEITAQLVRDMLGLSDKSKIASLFKILAEGNVSAAFELFNQLYVNGGDPVLILNDLLEFTYLVTRIKSAPKLDVRGAFSESETESARKLAESLDVSYLTRLWQMLLKGLDEVKTAPDSFAASEMIMVRIAYMSDLPAPAKVIKEGLGIGDSGLGGSKIPETQVPVQINNIAQHLSVVNNAPASSNDSMLAEEDGVILNPQSPTLTSFQQLVDLFKEHREVMLHGYLTADARLVSFEPGRLEIAVGDSVPAGFAGKVSDLLIKWTGLRWVVVLSKQQGEPTIQEAKFAAEDQLKSDISKEPEINKLLEMFPGAVIEKVS